MTTADQTSIENVVRTFFAAFTSGPDVKTIQFIRTAEGWRISAAAWDDERPGPTIG